MANPIRYWWDYYPPHPTMIVQAVGSLLWSIMLFWPGDTFGRPTYDVMSRIANEHAWAVVFGFHGAYALWATLRDVHTKTAFLLSGVLGCALWTGSCVSMLLSVYPPPAAIAGEIALAFASWWHLVRFQIDSRPTHRGK